MGAFVQDGGNGGGEKEHQIAREYGQQSRQKEERMNAELNSKQDRPR